MIVAGLIVNGSNVSDDGTVAVSYAAVADKIEAAAGQSITYTVYTTGVTDGTTLYWTNSGTTVASDFTGNAVSGSFTVTSNSGTVTLTLSASAGDQGAETVIFNVRTGSISGTIVSTAETVTVANQNRRYFIVPNGDWFIEGQTITYTITTANVPNGTVLYWTNSGTTIAADFTDNQNTGSVTINSNSGSITRTLASDAADNGETVILNLRLESVSGPIVATANTVTIYEPTYSVSPSTTAPGLGSTITYTVTTANVPVGTVLYWTNSGTAQSADFGNNATSGAFIVTSNNSTFGVTIAANATTGRTVIVQIRTDSTTGTVRATAATATITLQPGQQEYTTPGFYIWTAPAGVTSICVVCVGGGGGGSGTTSGGSGGGGGGLGWKNNIAVTPGSSYVVTVGDRGVSAAPASTTNGGDSYFIDRTVVAGLGGLRSAAATGAGAGGAGGGFVGDGGGNGGNGGSAAGTTQAGGGGGAGGYAGNGGNGATGTTNNSSAGSGGGGGGGGGGGSADTAGSGGGVGILGQGTNGSAGASTTADGRGGFGGSGGTDASFASTSTTAQNIYSTTNRSNPGLYGGGVGGSENGTGELANAGGTGAVRIIWGAGRSFPSTNTGNL
jgi:hypothetical protein